MFRGIIPIILILFVLVTGIHSQEGKDVGPTGKKLSTGKEPNSSGSGIIVDKSVVRSTSIARYNGGPATVHIWFFRGNGSVKESDMPLVNSSVIYNSTIDIASFPSIFTAPVTIDSMSEVESPKKDTLKIADPRKPLNIGNMSLYYFWGNSFLPQSNNSRECFNFTTSNDFMNISLCNVQIMERCEANISDLAEFSNYRFISPDGKMMSEFSWMCKKGQVCCEWECCDPAVYYGQKILFIIGSILALCLVLCLFGCCVEQISKRK